MTMLSRVSIVVPAAALMLLILLPTAQGRLVSPWSIDRLADKASLIAVGEVLDVTPVGTESRGENDVWIQDMNARVKILRMPTHAKANGLAVGDVITLWYQGYDWSKTAGVVNGLEFPQLSAGNCYAFPLEETNVDGSDRWKLIDREDIGLLTPCLRQPPKGPASETTKTLLITELANAIALGNAKDLARIALYCHQAGNESAVIDLLNERIASFVRDDESRWLDIAVIMYNGMGSPRPSIADLQAGKMQNSLTANSALVTKALSHISGKDLDDKFIKATIKYMDLSPWGTGLTLSRNYASNPLAASLLIERLNAGDRAAIEVSATIIRTNSDAALQRAAIQASMRLIGGPVAAPDVGWHAAIQLIGDYGSDLQFKALLDVFRKCLKEDHSKFFMMWQWLAYANGERMIPIIRIAITDDTPWPHGQGMRVSDVAAMELQRVTGVHFFSAGGKISDADRNQALEKARKWLAENP